MSVTARDTQAGGRGSRVALPHTISEAVDALGAMPGAQLLAGGTDFVVEVNYGLRRPQAVVGLRRVGELKGFEIGDREVVLRAGLTYTEMAEQLAGELPALAAAARTVGSPQIRNAGTLGGNVATASPAGDTLPVLVALGGRATVRGPQGERTMTVSELVTGVKRTAIQPDEILTHVTVPRWSGPQQFLKVGTRNAMVISIASAAVFVDPEQRKVRVALGSVGPVPVRPTGAEAFIAAEIDWTRLQAAPAALERFAQLTADAAQPITDHRSTAAYRRRAVEVITTRALQRSLSDARR